MKMKMKIKNRSHRYNVNRHRDNYSKYKKCLSIMMFICIKEHLSNICSLIHEKLSNTEAELKKVLRLKKKFYEFPELVLILKAHSMV